MANYKVIFRRDNQNRDSLSHWEPGCPLFVDALQISRNTETGQSYLQLRMINVSDKEVSEFAVEAQVTYRDGTSESQTIACLDADLVPASATEIKPLLLQGFAPVQATARVVSASVSGETSFYAGEGASIQDAPTIELSRIADSERRRILHKAGITGCDKPVGIIEDDDWWICVCGSPNIRRKKCCSCGLPRSTAKMLSNEKELEQSAADHSRTLRKRKAIMSTVAVAILCIGAVCAIGITSGTFDKVSNYCRAIDLKNRDLYIYAYDEFLELDSFLDSESQARNCAKAAADNYASKSDWEAARTWYDRAGETQLSEDASEKYQEAENKKRTWRSRKPRREFRKERKPSPLVLFCTR